MHKKEEEEHRDPKVVYFCCFIKCDVIFLKCLYEVDLEISELRLTRIVQKYFCTAQMCICTVLAYSVCLLYDGTVLIYLLCNGLKVTLMMC